MASTVMDHGDAPAAQTAAQSAPETDEVLLSVRDLKVQFSTDEGLITAVDGVDFEVKRGKTLGIVGESGSGKSVSTKALMQLLPRTAIIGERSQMLFTRADGSQVDIAGLSPQSREIRSIRGGEIAMIFQEPMASFSPVYSIGNQMIEAIRLHRRARKKEAREIAIDMLDRVGISNAKLRVDQYPHELSGGMRQRAMIALALSTRPSLLIADEPTTALDVTIQAQILELMDELQDEFGMSIIFITHDMGVIAQVADDVAVMYLGRVIESGLTDDVIHNPKHPYSHGLLAAIPSLETLHERLKPVPGDIPSPLERPSGCPFHTRCPEIIAGRCEQALPPSLPVSESHSVSCFLFGD